MSLSVEAPGERLDRFVARAAGITRGEARRALERGGVYLDGRRCHIASRLLREVEVIIAVAGMEGALPSVIAGLTDRPVIAVPTSVGYGASFGGLAALLGMLSSCAPGLTVVNIDNGFGAGYAAAAFLRTAAELAGRSAPSAHAAVTNGQPAASEPKR